MTSKEILNGVSLKDIEFFLSKTTTHCNNPQNIPKQLHLIHIRELLILVPSILYHCDFSVPLFADLLKTENVEFRQIFNSVNFFLSTYFLNCKHNGFKPINSQELFSVVKTRNIEPETIEKYIFKIAEIIDDFLEESHSVPVVIKSKPKLKPPVGKKSSILPFSGGSSRKKKNIKKRSTKKTCQGKIYIVDKKRWYVGEKFSSKKWGNNK